MKCTSWQYSTLLRFEFDALELPAPKTDGNNSQTMHNTICQHPSLSSCSLLSRYSTVGPYRCISPFCYTIHLVTARDSLCDTRTSREMASPTCQKIATMVHLITTAASYTAQYYLRTKSPSAEVHVINGRPKIAWKLASWLHFIAHGFKCLLNQKVKSPIEEQQRRIENSRHSVPHRENRS